ncbi:hypothetical protein Q8A67_008300 [Cirrhinus molitorella]|uniref:Uncharacterized protein n=1 Tax=Cirrhinus molitorella TaxID=172907 RepID=A0AA88PX27_9TELE|nr:hypothetical protein Q8A67_008300 [Cirrhinus molitorella]
MGLLAMLTQDCNIIRLYDMQHTPMPFSDEVEPTTNERSVQLCSKSISSSFAWHLSAQNCMMVVSPNWDMNDCSTSINIPASMVHVEPSVMQALRQASDCWDCDVGMMFNTRQKSEQKVLHTGDMNVDTP